MAAEMDARNVGTYDEYIRTIADRDALRAEVERLRAELAAVKEDEAMAAHSMAATINDLRARAEKAEEYLRNANAELAKEKQRADENYMAFERAAEKNEAATAHAGRLRAALESIGSELDKCKTYPVGVGLSGQTTQNYILGTAYHRAPYAIRHVIYEALFETPATLLNAVKAAAYRELKQYERQQGDSFFVWWRDIEAMAERLEKEAE